jgi:hypothetical protein
MSDRIAYGFSIVVAPARAYAPAEFAKEAIDV